MPGETYDVVVVGSGIAGLSTALAARELGLRPIVIEKSDKLGGGTAVSYGGIWVGLNYLQLDAGYSDTRDDVLRYMRFVGGNQIDEEKLLAFVDHAPAAIRFFAKAGIRFRITKGLVDHYYPDVPGSTAEGRSIEPDLISAQDLGEWRDKVLIAPNAPTEYTVEELITSGGITTTRNFDQSIAEERRKNLVRGRGVALVTHYVKQLLAREVPILTGVTVQRLLTEAGRVVGVEANDGTTFIARAGVALATGAYESNNALAATYEGLPRWESMYPASITGDGLIMATEIGAYVDKIHNNLALFLGFTIPPERSQDPPFFRLVGISEMPCPHTMVVNGSARRFADETYFQAMGPKLREYTPSTHRFANLPCFLIFDSQYCEKFSFAGRPLGASIPDWVERAGTLRELGTALGIDGATLENTAARFSDFAAQGVDEDFGRGKYQWSLARRDRWNDSNDKKSNANPTLGPVNKAPFYGVELHPSAFASAGLRTNAQAQVLHQRGSPIGGLYAVGNASVHTEYGVGYQAGYSLASGITFGYLAAKHCAQAAG